MAFRNKRNGRTLSQDMQESLREFENLTDKLLPEKAEVILMDTVQSSFDQEKYADGKSSKWDNRKTLDKSAGKRKLLVKSGDLRRSFETFHRGDEVGIGTDVVYAQRHNEGLKGMPERQHMPKPGEDNPVVEKKLDEYMDRELDKIFK